MAYLIKRGCSTRKLPDPRCPDFIEYRPGDIVESFPAHVPVGAWITLGVIVAIGEVPVEAEAPKVRKAR